MSPLPFPTDLYRAIGENSITVVEHDYDGAPTAVCVLASSAFERAAALALLENSPTSFVVSHGLRYSPNGGVQPYAPARPWYADELPMLFDVEWVMLGLQPQVYVFTHTEKEWETARQAMKHLLQLGRLSRRSYLEGNHTGEDQGLSAQNLDGKPHGPGLVAQFRDAAICIQNSTVEDYDCGDDDPSFLLILAAREQRERSAREREEEELDEEAAGHGED